MFVLGANRGLKNSILAVSGARFVSSVAVLSSNVESYRPRSADEAAVRIGALALGAVTISTVRSDGHEITSVEPTRWTTFMPINGSLTTRMGGKTLLADRAIAVQLAPGKRTTCIQRLDGGAFIGIGLSVAFRSPSQWMALRPSAPLCFDLRSMPAARALRGHLGLVVQEWARPGGLMNRPRMRLASEALILDLVAAMWEESAQPAEAPHADRAATLVRWAEAVMHARSDEPLRLADLAREAGVGIRTLQLAFQSQRGASPRAVLNGFRLDRVRDRLLYPTANTTVTEAALASGFSHLSRFAHAYRMQFGEHPSATLARALR